MDSGDFGPRSFRYRSIRFLVSIVRPGVDPTVLSDRAEAARGFSGAFSFLAATCDDWILSFPFSVAFLVFLRHCFVRLSIFAFDSLSRGLFVSFLLCVGILS